MTPKEIERLKAFIRLANNNPNENEANSAARRLCKILADYEFNESPTTWNDVRRTTEPDFRSSYGFDPFEHLRRTAQEERRKAAEARKRREEEQQKNEPSQAQEDFFYDWRTYSNFTGGSRAGKSNNTKDIKCPKCQSSTYYSPQHMQYSCTNVNCRHTFSQIQYHANPPRSEKRIRTCSVCGKEVETKRITSIFRCDTCEWTEYERVRAEAGRPSAKGD